MPASRDVLFHWFRQHGWSVSEAGMVELDGKTSWVVTARHGEDVVLAKSPTQAEAWAKAVRLVAHTDDDGPNAESGS